MDQKELADVFERIAQLMEIKGELVYKYLAYRKAADSLRNLAEDIHTVREQGRLVEIPGVGKAIAQKIEELLDTGRLGFLETLEGEVPPSLIEVLNVPDVGPKKAALFWRQANVIDLVGLEAAARSGRLRELPGMGEKSEQRILAGIEALKRRSNRMLLGNAVPAAQRWLEWLRALPGVQRAETAGSLRRWKNTIGDFDLVAASDRPAEVMEAFVTHPEVTRVKSRGENKSSVEFANGLGAQLWIQPPERFGTLWQYATGSKDHNVRLRELSQRLGFSLSEQALLDEKGQEILFAEETDLYAHLGLDWVPPELREDHGEVLAAKEHRLPAMLRVDQLVADLHCHTRWSDGAETIENMARAAMQRGLRVLAITDHSRGLGVAGGLSEEDLRQQWLEIETVQQQLGDGIRLLKGAEVEIRADGSLDFADETLAAMDVVVASLHSGLRQPREVITQRLVTAMRSPHVDIIGHPSGRLLLHREPSNLDMETVLREALANKVVLEINANPSRLDLDEVYARRAAEMGILLSIDSDAHSPDQFDLLKYGVSVARRAWVNPQQMINTWEPEQLLSWLARRGRILD
jgi:DNA polymerase (family 10)